MAAKETSTSNNQLGTRISVVEYKVDELKKGQDRIENKLDLINYVPLTTYHSDQQEAERVYATKQDIEPFIDLLKNGKKVMWAVITVFAIAIATYAFTGGFKEIFR